MSDEIQSGKDWIELNIDNLIDQQQEDNDDKEMLSTCCGEKALGNIHEFDGEHFGLCGDPKCYEHTDFKSLED
tara:strand:- start:2676 stop:2894 length:219 start_codon:yes stop_codon:yes gene_type:complete